MVATNRGDQLWKTRVASADEIGYGFDQLAEQADRGDHVTTFTRWCWRCSKVLQQAIDSGGILLFRSGIGDEFADTQQIDAAMQNHGGCCVQGLLLKGKQQRFLIQVDKVDFGENVKQQVQVEIVRVSSPPYANGPAVVFRALTEEFHDMLTMFCISLPRVAAVSIPYALLRCVRMQASGSPGA